MMPTNDMSLTLSSDDALTQTYDTWLSGQLSEETKRAYKSDIAQFQAWIYDEYGITDLSMVERKQVIGWRDFLKSQKRSNGTISRKLAALAALFSEAVASDIMARNPADPERVKRYKVSDESPRAPLDNHDIRILLQKPDRQTLIGVRDYAILTVLVYMGLRRAEIAALTIGSIGHERGHVTLRIIGKGQKVRMLPVPPRVSEAIKAYLKLADRLDDSPDSAIFMPTMNNRDEHHTTEKPLSHDAIWRIIKKYAAMAEIPLDKITTHVLRHTAITNAIENGASVHRVQYMAGHSDVKTTMRYVGRRDNLDDSAINKIDYSE